MILLSVTGLLIADAVVVSGPKVYKCGSIHIL